jgi:hypothetical protein
MKASLLRLNGVTKASCDRQPPQPYRIAPYLWWSLATAFAGSRVQTSMALSLNSSVETLGNLMYLIRHSLGNPAEARTYLNIADKVLVEIASNRPLTPAGSVPPASEPPARR